MKKFTVILLVIIMTMCAFLTVHAEAESVLSLDFASCALGESLTVPVRITDNPGVAAIYIKVTYDTEMLKLDSVEDLELINDFQYNDNSGTLILSWEPATENALADGILANLHFTLKDTATVGSYTLTLEKPEHGIIDKSGNDVNINLINGSYQITLPTDDIISATLAIDKTKMLISNIAEKTTVTEISQRISTDAAYHFENKGIVLESSKYVTTGTKLIITESDLPIKEYTLIVTGDNSGDGKITVKDMLNIRSETKKAYLENEYFYSSDINGDGNVDETDFTLVKSHILHNTKIIGVSHLH